MDVPVAIATRIEVIEWFNKERQELEWIVQLTVYTETGVYFVGYRARDFNDLIGDQIQALKILIERGFDTEEGR